MPTLAQGILAALAIFAAIVLILWLPPHQRRRKRTHGTHVVTRAALHPPIHVHVTHCPGCACERTP